MFARRVRLHWQRRLLLERVRRDKRQQMRARPGGPLSVVGRQLHIGGWRALLWHLRQRNPALRPRSRSLPIGGNDVLADERLLSWHLYDRRERARGLLLALPFGRNRLSGRLRVLRRRVHGHPLA